MVEEDDCDDDDNDVLSVEPEMVNSTDIVVENEDDNDEELPPRRTINSTTIQGLVFKQKNTKSNGNITARSSNFTTSVSSASIDRASYRVAGLAIFLATLAVVFTGVY